MSQFKLIYFNARGRAETSRILFALAGHCGQDYVDERFSFEEWPQRKPGTLFGVSPELEVDGVRICQSMAIARFLTKKFGYAGKTPLEEAQADMIVDCMQDVMTPVAEVFRQKTEEEKAAKLKHVTETFLPDFYSKLEKLLVSNGGGDGYFVGSNMTWADVHLLTIMGVPGAMDIPISFEAYPKISNLKNRLENIPEIKNWIESRPKTKR